MTRCLLPLGTCLPAFLLSFLLAACSDTPAPGGFAGLAASSEAEDGFRQPRPGDTIRLPEDWGPHPAHRIEWWYLTANLTTADGVPMGIQWTQFRQGLEPREPDDEPPAEQLWPLESAWMAHGAVSFNGRHWFSERFARGDVGHAGARAEPLRVWLDHWQLMEAGRDQWQLEAAGEGWAYNLTLLPSDRVVRHGDNGFSAKTEGGQGSMYFSDPDIAMEGTVTIGGEPHSVSGTGWLDREWSSQFLRSDQEGWDWFALRLDTGARLMAFRVGRGDNAYLSGTWIDPAGVTSALGPKDLVLSPLGLRDTGGGRIPDRWRIDVLPEALTFTVTAPEGSYWNRGAYPYWESPVTVSGDASGEGYMELTGYGAP
ncbi:Predicted secreted hydrolase [Marinobacter daqiaonensis]|uniref:Predicted secreted hydrolase n=1 Tax=Marinobacter daqiaonensis TaxID=650891 RepID=A0A1I6I6H3_9GAMM|nr:lipocalin-like domain-containing protein [Marinobacter daqiaonensis]SFR62291.1 Predicted secreted hydrolase [Marinobacter daqiaonensis]